MLTDADREALIGRLMLEYGGEERDWTAMRSFKRLTNQIEAIVERHVTAVLNSAADEIEQWRDMHRRGADLIDDDAASDVLRAIGERSRVRHLAYARAARIVRAANPQSPR